MLNVALQILLAIPQAPLICDTSDCERIGKTVEFAGTAGFEVLPLPSVGATAGWFVRPDTVAEANISRGTLSLYIFKAYSDVQTLRIKEFWGNSFYTNVGVARRTIGVGLTPSTFIGTNALDDKTEITTLAAAIGIGNMWQWKTFTLGVDWAGILWPLMTVGSKDDFPDNLLSSAAKSEKRKIIGTIAGGRSYQGIQVVVGFGL